MTASYAVRWNPCTPEHLSAVFRDRIIHLLAIRPYKKPELMARLQKGGITDNSIFQGKQFLA